jgi:hypothetical protein
MISDGSTKSQCPRVVVLASLYEGCPIGPSLCLLPTRPYVLRSGFGRSTCNLSLVTLLRMHFVLDSAALDGIFGSLMWDEAAECIHSVRAGLRLSAFLIRTRLVVGELCDIPGVCHEG